MRKCLLLLPLMLASPALAQQSALPDSAAVTAALEAHPVVQAADARLDAAKAEARGLSVGPHEAVLSGTYARRDVREAGLGPARYDEYEGQITRAFRLPGKAGLDRKIGAEGITYADNMAGDARHQTALRLAQFWWNWLDAAALASVDRQATANAESLLATVKRRMSLRAASALEGDQAEAALAMARAAAARSAGAEAIAKARLVAQFPSLPLPVATPEVPMPDATPDRPCPLPHCRWGLLWKSKASSRSTDARSPACRFSDNPACPSRLPRPQPAPPGKLSRCGRGCA